MGYKSGCEAGNQEDLSHPSQAHRGSGPRHAQDGGRRRYCIDIITQVQAITAALKKVEGEIPKDHVTHCVEHAVASGDKKAQRDKIEELVEVLSRAIGIGRERVFE